MNLRPYLDSTYLKTADQAGLTELENRAVVEFFINEAIQERFKLIMIRPNYVSLARNIIQKQHSKLEIGTVIDFPEGKSSTVEKLSQALVAIENGADDLDFVCNYEAFQRGELDAVKDEIFRCTQIGLEHKKVVKWIIEVAALSDKQIIQLSALIKNCVISKFKQEQLQFVFVKSSTGFYKTKEGIPNGATKSAVLMMLENASPLPIKAAGGVRTYQEAVEMIELGVKRIGTSGAKAIVDGDSLSENY